MRVWLLLVTGLGFACSADPSWECDFVNNEGLTLRFQTSAGKPLPPGG
jgi:hypothetical protein